MIISEPNSPEAVIEKRREHVDAILELLKHVHFKTAAEKEELVQNIVASGHTLKEIEQLRDILLVKQYE